MEVEGGREGGSEGRKTDEDKEGQEKIKRGRRHRDIISGRREGRREGGREGRSEHL